MRDAVQAFFGMPTISQLFASPLARLTSLLGLRQVRISLLKIFQTTTRSTTTSKSGLAVTRVDATSIDLPALVRIDDG